MADETTTIPFIRTKLHRPPVPRNHVHRARLLERLDERRYRPLTLVSAPAGYGKSTLVSCWLDRCEIPFAWLSLDEHENNLRSFLTYFLGAVHTMFPHALDKTITLVNAPNLPPQSTLVGSLANELDSIEEDFILVLDDIHFIQDKSVHDLLKMLLHHPPRPMHLVLIGRRDPPLPMSKLRGRDQVTEIRTLDLSFTVAETAEFLQVALEEQVDESTAAALAQRAEGWVTGLRLAVLAVRGHHDAIGKLLDLKGTTAYVMDYLIKEVLEAQLPVIRRYLVSTSILDRFCASLCDALCGPDTEAGEGEIDGQGFVTSVQQRNLLVIPLDTENRWFRYHHLFQDLLQSHLKRRYSSEEIATLRSRASEWFAENGLIDEAIQHALAAGNLIGAAQLVERNRQAVLNADRWYALEKWLSMLPDDLIRQRPGLLLGRAWILYHHFDISRIPPVIVAAEPLLSDSRDDESLGGEIDFFRGYFYYFQNNGVLSLQHLDDARKRIFETNHEIRGQIEILHGLANQMQGQQEGALDTLKRLLADHQWTKGITRTRLLATLVYIHIISGDLAQAGAANQQLYDYASKSSYAYARAWSVYLEGLIHLYRNEVEAAIGCFVRAVEQKYILHTRAVADSMAGLAFAYQTAGKAEDALATINALREYGDSIQDPTSSLIADSCNARLSILQEAPKPIAAFLQGSPPPDENMVWWIEIPAVTYRRALLAEGSDASLKSAETGLKELLQLNLTNNNTLHSISTLSLLAAVYQKQGRIDEALSALERSLSLTDSSDIIQPFVELGPPMIDLLERLRKQNVSVDHINRILAAFPETDSIPPLPDLRSTNDDLRFESEAVNQSQNSLVDPLTNRELDILDLLGQRLQNKEIAEELSISPTTVKTHLQNIYQKLCVKNRRQAVESAEALGILSHR